MDSFNDRIPYNNDGFEIKFSSDVNDIPADLRDNLFVKEYTKYTLDKQLMIAFRRDKATGEWREFTQEEKDILNAKAKLLPDFSWKSHPELRVVPEEETEPTEDELVKAERLLEQLRSMKGEDYD